MCRPDHDLASLRYGLSHGHVSGSSCTINVHAADGSIEVFHTGQEMGQGLTTKCAMTISMRLGVPLDKIYVHGTNTSVVPNDTVSGGSTTSEALCHAADLACDELLERLKPHEETLNKDKKPDEPKATFAEICGAAFGGGFILGPVIGGFLGEMGTRAPFYATAGLAFANALFVCWVMPETLARENRRAFDWKRANPLGALKQLRQFPVVYGLAVAVFFFMLGHWVLPATWSYYTIERFSWSEREIGFSLAFVGVLMMFVQAYLIRVVSQIWSPGRMVFIALVSATVSLVGYALAPAAWPVYLFMLVGAVQGFFSPAVNTIATARVGADAQGELQGSLGSLSSLAAMLSPPLMTAVFEHYSASANGVAEAVYFPGAPYLLAAGLTMIAGGFVWHALRQR